MTSVSYDGVAVLKELEKEAAELRTKLVDLKKSHTLNHSADYLLPLSANNG